MQKSAAPNRSAADQYGTIPSPPVQEVGLSSLRDDLFSRFALALGIVDQETLDKARAEQSTSPTKSLAEVLMESGAVTAGDKQALEHLLERHLAKQGDDPQTNISSLVSYSTQVNSPPPLAETISFEPATPVARRLQRLFGDYELLSEIARGGMGVVYKARQAKLNRLVALKMIRSGELADDEQVKRFYSEAEAAAKLDHPGIVPVYEVGQTNGQHFFSMALVAGTSLNERVKNDGPLQPKEAARLLKSVVEAVEYAHRKGIIHRDIKPQNILLDEAGQPRLTDFGLAKQAASQSDLTATGQVMGTPSYMPPEQASGKLDEIGPASDVYSLGATLYFVLTGRPPFQTATPAETIQQVLNIEPVALKRLNPAIPRDLETICLKSLRKEPAKRYATAAELAVDLGNWLENRPIVARPVGRAEKAWLWCKRRPTLVGMSLLLVVLAVVGTSVALERQNATRAAANVEALLVAPPQGVPYVLENLSSMRWHALPILRERLTEKSREPSQRLHAAMALAQFGEVDVPFLIASIPQAQAGECDNIAGALRRDQTAAIARLKAQFATATKPNDRFRLSVMALQLGEAEPAKQMLALAADPSQRTLFIHFHEWRGNLDDYARLLLETDDADFQSGLCQALGQIPVTELTASERQALEPVLKHLYEHSLYGSVHSVAKWAMQQWKLDVPKTLATDPAKPAKDWYVNPLGMTLLKIPAGSFERLERQAEDGTDKKTLVTLSKAFWLGDCEVTRKQFEAFIADPEYPPAEKPVGWIIRELYCPTADCPVNGVNWIDAILFCNWLSRREGLSPYYERTGEKQKVGIGDAKLEWDVWRSVPEAGGYRLPTDAEWEYACRAKSATNFCFGDDESLLGHYAIFFTDKTQPVSSRQPNGWGLFDMHGNIYEWNNDWYDSNSGLPSIDQAELSAGPVLRGGSFSRLSVLLRSAHRNISGPANRSGYFGFRLARNYP